MYMCMCGFVHMNTVLISLEESGGSLGAGVSGSYKLPKVTVGNLTPVLSAREVYVFVFALNC